MSSLKCSKCVQTPVLVVSGYPPPKDLVCPVCKQYFCIVTGLTEEQTKNAIEEWEKKEAEKNRHRVMTPTDWDLFRKYTTKTY